MNKKLLFLALLLLGNFVALAQPFVLDPSAGNGTISPWPASYVGQLLLTNHTTHAWALLDTNGNLSITDRYGNIINTGTNGYLAVGSGFAISNGVVIAGTFANAINVTSNGGSGRYTIQTTTPIYAPGGIQLSNATGGTSMTLSNGALYFNQRAVFNVDPTVANLRSTAATLTAASLKTWTNVPGVTPYAWQTTSGGTGQYACTNFGGKYHLYRPSTALSGYTNNAGGTQWWGPYTADDATGGATAPTIYVEQTIPDNLAVGTLIVTNLNWNFVTNAVGSTTVDRMLLITNPVTGDKIQLHGTFLP